MSIKDFFSAKQKGSSKTKSTQIGGRKNDTLDDAITEDTFVDDDFIKNGKDHQEGELVSSTSNGHMDTISLDTDMSHNTVFTNKFDDVEDFENQLNKLSDNEKSDSNKQVENLSFSMELESVETDDKKEFTLGTEDNFDLGTGILDIELEKSSLEIAKEPELDLKKKLVDEEFKKFDSQIDEKTLLALYEEEAKEQESTSTPIKKTTKIGKINEEDSDLLKSQINELNLLYSAGALADEQDKEELQEKLDVVEPEFHNELETESTEDLELPPSRNRSNQMGLGSLGHLDAALDVQTISPVDATTLSYHDREEPVIQKKKYNSIKKEQYKKSIFGNMSVRTQYMMFCTTLVVSLVGIGSAVSFSYDANNKE